MVYIASQHLRVIGPTELRPRLLLKNSLRPAYLLSHIAALLALVASVGGLLYGSRGLYDPDPYALQHPYAQDTVTLVFVWPLLLLGMHWTRRGSVRGLLLWTAALSQLIYTYFFYVTDVRFNVLFLTYIAVLSTSLFALMKLLTGIEPEAVQDRFRADVPVRGIATYLVAMAALFGLLWIGDVIRSLLQNEPIGGLIRLIYALDLTVVLPAMAAVGVWLWRRQAWGFVLAGAFLLRLTTLGLTILINTFIVVHWHQEVSSALTVIFALLTLAGFLYGIRFIGSARASQNRQMDVYVDVHVPDDEYDRRARWADN
jgi:hypothetical protein